MFKTVPILALLACDLHGVARHPVAEAVKGAVAHDVDPAAAEIVADPRCKKLPSTYEAALAELTVPIVETRITRGAMTAAPGVLLVPRGWSELSADEKLLGLREELTHYCQRRTFPGFDQLWLTGRIDEPCAVTDGKCVGVVLPRSDYRAAFEVAAKRAAGVRIDVDRLIDAYVLHDLRRESLEDLIEGAP